MAATTAPSPGWYPDPHGPDHLRWWDGGGWTDHTTDAPARKPQPAFVADILDYPHEDEDHDPIEFSWEDECDDFVLTVADFDHEPEPEPVAQTEPEPAVELDPAPEPEPAAAQAPGPGFNFRARALEPQPASERRPARPVYESPLATIFSPLPVRAAAPVVVETIEPATTEFEPAAPAPARSPVPRLAVKGSVGLVVCAALAAQVTNMLRDDDKSTRPAAPGAAAAGISTADKSCLKEWNTTASGTAAEVRVTLGQFTGAYARVGRVDPLPGTLMAPDSCALTVYDPATDTNVVFVSGVPDQVGFMDVTSYPRAKAYGWPKSANQANVAVREDGTIASLTD